VLDAINIEYLRRHSFWLDLNSFFSILVAYNQISGAIIYSFDKKVNKLCK